MHILVECPLWNYTKWWTWTGTPIALQTVRLYNKIHPLPAHEPGTAFQQLFWLLSERASKAFLSPVSYTLHGSYKSTFKMKFEGQNYYDYMNVNADRTRKNVFKAQLNGCILLYQDWICVLFLKIWIWLFLRHIFLIPKRDNFEILSSISPRWLHLLKI